MMKDLSVRRQVIPRGVAAQRGFALIITISLMAFLVLLLITVGTFTRIETEVASYTQKQSIAREHAKMAMEIAIGELQRYAGHDERVTARADLLEPALSIDNQEDLYDFWEERNPFWTGVWNTNYNNISSDFPVWLVSGNEHVDLGSTPFGGSPNFQFPDPGTPSPLTPDMDPDTWVESIYLVYEGTAATTGLLDGFDGRVRVPKQPILVESYPGLADEDSDIGPYDPTVPFGDLSGHRIGHYAYWVGDEGVKANVTAAGLRYPLEEWFRKDNENPYNADFADFTPPTKEDQVATSLNPSRLGFEVWTETFPDLFEEDFNPLAYRWYDVVSRHQVPMVELSGGDTAGFTAGEMKSLFHDTTALSHGVLSNPNDGRLKVDYTRDPTLLGGDWGNYAGYPGAETRFDDESDFDLGYPLGVIGLLNDSGVGWPIVSHIRLEGQFESQGANNPVFIRFKPLAGIWNPYTADLTWGGGASGYEFDIRFFYDADEGENNGNLFLLRLGAGLIWEIPPEEPGGETEFHYNSWFSGDIDLFGFFGRPVDGEDTIEFTTPVSLIRSGENAIFGAMAGDQIDRGRDSQFTSFQNSVAFDVQSVRPDPEAVLIEARPTLYLSPDSGFDDFEPGVWERPEVTVRVAAIPEGDDDGEVVIHEETISLEIFGNIETEAPADYGREPGEPGDPDTDGAVRQEWDSDWDTSLFNDPDQTLVVPIGPSGVTGKNFMTPGEVMDFSWGFGMSDLVTQDRATRIEFYGRYQTTRPNFPTWGSNDRFGYGRQRNQSQGVDETEFTVLRDLPRTESGLTPTSRVPITSVGQLQHSASGAAPSSRYDQGFFSTLVDDPSTLSLDDPLLLWNPRMKPFVGGNSMEMRVQGNGGGGRVDADALDNFDDAERAAANLLVDGAFNVNSTSVAAWAALLNGFARQEVTIWDPTQTGGSLAFDPVLFTDSHFSRFSHSPGASYYGREDVTSGEVHRRSIWRNGFRQLRPLDLGEGVPNHPDTIEDAFFIEYESPYSPGDWYENAAMAMAEYIVHRIRDELPGTNGGAFEGRPFFSMEEFVDSGILQDAIDNINWRSDDGFAATGLNWYFDDIWQGGGWFEIPERSPSFLSQNDILAAIGSVLTVRSDTFVIRTYGDAYNPVTDEVEARAYLEAVVQRVPTPVEPDPGETPPAVNPDPNSLHGRKFEVISFRWLSPDEI